MRIGTALITAAAVAAGLFSLPAMAARPYAISNIYLDGNDNIIGQSIGYCNNVDIHAGTVDYHNPYVIIQQVSCDLTQPQVLGITAFNSATGQTVDFYCNAAHPAGTPFAGSPGCDGSIPMKASGLGPWLDGPGNI